MNAPVIYVPNAIPLPDMLFSQLQALTWEQREAPRQEYYCNDFPEPYVYGKGPGQRTYMPQPYTHAINMIRRIAEDEAESILEVCFLNRYLDQSQHLGWHADDSPEMDDARPIVIVSLGVEREIWFRPKTKPSREGLIFTNTDEIDRLKLGHGSLCIMQPGMQDAWQHRIPKAGFICGERISLTFRGYVKP